MSYKIHEFKFSHKVDILGIWGTTSDNIDKDEPDIVEHIHSLGFITNECPSRNILEFEQHIRHRHTWLSGAEDIIEKDIEENPAMGGVIVLIMLLSICTCSCYFCLKNRGTLFKRATQQPAQPVSGDSMVNSHVMDDKVAGPGQAEQPNDAQA